MYEKYSEDLDFLGESVNVRRCGVGFVNIVRSFFYKGNREIFNLDIINYVNYDILWICGIFS